MKNSSSGWARVLIVRLPSCFLPHAPPSLCRKTVWGVDTSRSGGRPKVGPSIDLTIPHKELPADQELFSSTSTLIFILIPLGSASS